MERFSELFNNTSIKTCYKLLRFDEMGDSEKEGGGGGGGGAGGRNGEMDGGREKGREGGSFIFVLL